MSPPFGWVLFAKGCVDINKNEGFIDGDMCKSDIGECSECEFVSNSAMRGFYFRLNHSQRCKLKVTTWHRNERFTFAFENVYKVGKPYEMGHKFLY